MPPFDVVIWGATGFTGRLVAQYFATQVARRYPAISCALAGRDPTKLEAARSAFVQAAEEAGNVGCKAPGVLVGNSESPETVDQVVQQGRVVVSVAGPFIKYGTPVVDACVRHGCHYVDITGEPPWVRQLIETYDAAARAKGVSIVNMCGFDSVPSDIGTLVALDELKRSHGQNARSAMAYMRMKGHLSGGTMASGIEMESRGLMGEMAKPFLLGGGPASGAARHEDADVTAAAFDEDVRAWVGPFMMAAINTRVVRRSQALLGADAGYGPDFAYNEVHAVGSEESAAKLARPLPGFKKRQAMVDAGVLPKPGEGPTAEQRAAASFECTVVARGEAGAVVASKFSGGDPGYDETAKMVSEAAIHLLEQDAAERRGGVVTPACALGLPYASRLREAGLKIHVDAALSQELQGRIGGPSKL